MSENEKDLIGEEVEDDFSSSTIFAAPVEHKDKKKAGKFKLPLRLLHKAWTPLPAYSHLHPC